VYKYNVREKCKDCMAWHGIGSRMVSFVGRITCRMMRFVYACESGVDLTQLICIQISIQFISSLASLTGSLLPIVGFIQL
jgi:hypothetical protein